MPGEPNRRAYVVLVDGSFDVHNAKTACSLIRYRPHEVVAALDASQAGRTVQEVIGFGGEIPVVGTLEAALELKPNRLLVGTASPGGQLAPGWRPVLLAALGAGLDLFSGLHWQLRHDSELVALAQSLGRRLVDLRAVPEGLSTPSGTRRSLAVPVVLTVGSDCNVGKMTALLEVQARAEASGRRYGFAATGQTGVLLAGSGIAVDAVVSDFLAGAAERLTVEAAQGCELVLVEGQGSLLHPFFSGVTLGLLHGCQPEGMILCHVAGRHELRYPPGVRVPPLARLAEIYEAAAGWVAPSRVMGIALATHHLPEAEARELLRSTEAETGLAVEDPVRFPTGALFEACEGLRLEGAAQRRQATEG